MSGAASAATDSSFDEVMYQCELGMISIIDASRERLEDRLDIALRFTRAELRVIEILSGQCRASRTGALIRAIQLPTRAG